MPPRTPRPHSSSNSNIPPPDPPPDVATTDIIAQMKSQLGSLSQAFDSLGALSARLVKQGANPEIVQQLESLRTQMQEQDKKHTRGLKEIDELLKQLMTETVYKKIDDQIEAEINAQIDSAVDEQVALLLTEKHIISEEQEELAVLKRNLETVQRKLHNSESRRANSELSPPRDNDTRLHTVYKQTGEVAEAFPRTLGALFKIDEDTVKQLLLEYGQPAADSREINMNRFIDFCGVLWKISTQVQQYISTPLEDDIHYQSPVAVRRASASSPIHLPPTPAPDTQPPLPSGPSAGSATTAPPPKNSTTTNKRGGRS